jgi:hypothetical protein
MRWTVVSRAARAVLLALLLGLHLLTRLDAHSAIPLGERHFYPTSYLVSLSLVSGHGFNFLVPRGSSAELPLSAVVETARAKGGAAGRVMDFISGQGPDELSRHDLDDFLASGAEVVPVSNTGPGAGGSGLLATSRVLDIHVTAWLWRLFGIGWPALFAFYALVSTIANLCVFLIARRLGGSFWAGAIASLGFLASPLECYAATWSIRDTCPLWFAALGYCLLLRLYRPSPRLALACAGWVALGFFSLVGIGWRPDVQLLTALSLASLVVWLVLVDRQPASRVALAAACFVAGCVLVHLLIAWLGAWEYRKTGGPQFAGWQDGHARTDFVSGTFHVAWYGEQARSELLGTENTFQVARDDRLTVVQADYFGERRAQRGEPAASLGTHFERSRAMYLELAAYEAYAWWLRFPAFLQLAARVDRPVVPGANTRGGDENQARAFVARRPGWLKAAYRYVLDPYRQAVPWLFALGLVTSLLSWRVLALPLGAFFFGYAALLMLTLPESKHWAQLLLPLHVFAALGLFDLVAFGVRLSSRSPARWPGKVPAVRAALAVAALMLGWALVGVVAKRVSRGQRQRIAQSILDHAPAGPAGWESLQQAKLVSFRVASAAAPPAGYLLKVKGGNRTLDLFCIHVREASEGQPPLAYWTRHVVEPGREQYFFVNLVTSARTRDPRPYTIHVRATGSSRLTASARLDLSTWSIGLPLSFVFEPGDGRAGAPFIGDELPATQTLSVEEVRALLP